MAKSDLSHNPVFCATCGGVVPIERARQKSVTCSKEHAKLREHQLRNMRELKKCKYCDRPSNPAERGQFKKWRRLQKTARESRLIPVLRQMLGDVEGTKITGVPINGQQVDVRELRRFLQALDDQEPDLAVAGEDDVEMHQEQEVA